MEHRRVAVQTSLSMRSWPYGTYIRHGNSEIGVHVWNTGEVQCTLNSVFTVCTMVLILDGNSEIGENVWNTGELQCKLVSVCAVSLMVLILDMVTQK